MEQYTGYGLCPTGKVWGEAYAHPPLTPKKSGTSPGGADGCAQASLWLKISTFAPPKMILNSQTLF